MSDYVTTKQAAELLGVDMAHVNHLLTAGRIHGQKLGRDWLVYRPSLDEYIKTKAPSGRPSGKRPKLERN